VRFRAEFQLEKGFPECLVALARRLHNGRKLRLAAQSIK
jgi:hypothetical protein